MGDERALKRGNGCALICRNHEERWQTTMTQFPDASLSELAHPVRALIMSSLRCPDPRCAFFTYVPFIYLDLLIESQKNFRRKIKISNIQRKCSFLPIHLVSSQLHPKCPTKIGICREHRIPEVGCGLSGKLFKVLRVLLISFLLSSKRFSSHFSPKLLLRDAILSTSIAYMSRIAYFPNKY